MSCETTHIRCGFKGKTQLPLFMVWREYRLRGEVVYAEVLFQIREPARWFR
jgi:hypothetical protein